MIDRYIATILALVALLFTACGDDDDDGSAGSEGSAGEAQDTGTGDAGPGGESEPDSSEAADGGPTGTEGGEEAPADLDYSDDAMWVCKPGAADNPCEADVSATEILPDNTLGDTIARTVKQDADFDCFYVYPTVDLQLSPGNHMDLSNNEAVKSVANVQAARFASVCRVFAPYYRQMTIFTYILGSGYQPYFDFAYNDVIDAFNYYLENFNDGRDIVLIGHSQGSHVLTRLLSEEFDNDAEMRGKLISALLVGTTDLFVPTGQKVGGTYQNIPLCSSETETGCVVAYNTVSAASDQLPIGVKQPPEGQEVACVNPAALGGGKAGLVSYVAVSSQPYGAVGSESDLGDVTTPYALYRDFFSAECVSDNSVPALLVEPAPASDSEQRVNPYDFASVAAFMVGATNSLHIIDIDLTIGNLVELVESQGEAKQ